jgi:hypothetical protein
VINVFFFARLGVLFGDSFLGQVFTEATWIELCSITQGDSL